MNTNYSTLHFAYIAVVLTSQGYGVGIAEENMPGYVPRPDFGIFDSFAAAEQQAKQLNTEQLKLSSERAYEIICSSMSRWSQQ